MTTYRSKFALFFAALVGLTALAGSGMAQDGEADAAAEADKPKDQATVRETEGGEGAGNILLDYRGKLQDSQGTPVSGVFHFQYNIYTDSNAAEPIWSERQYVSVIDGTYKVPLGSRTTLKRETISGLRWIGIELVGEGEIVRDRLKVDSAKQGGGESEKISQKTKKLLKKAAQGDKIAFADVAERAVKADQADVAKEARKIGSLSADEVERLSNLALERLGEHIADPNAHGAVGRTLGKQPRIMDQIGGKGGGSYRSECPPGYVVTGIKGGSGAVVDSIAIICRRLQ